MSYSKPFTSRLYFYRRNIEDAKSIHARPAWLTRDDKTHEPAVALFRGKQFLAIFPVDEGYRLANQIADGIEIIQGQDNAA